MSVLTGPAIEQAIKDGDLVIDPLLCPRAGPNSIDLHLGPDLYRYDLPRMEGWRQHLRRLTGRPEPALDPYDLPPLVEVPRSLGYWRLEPGVVYLGCTLEYTEIKRHVPYLDGRSSLGRLGVFLHVTAGRGDVGFKGRWTCELVAVQPVWLRPRMRIAQLTLHEAAGEIRPYVGRYQGDGGPVASRLVPQRGHRG